METNQEKRNVSTFEGKEVEVFDHSLEYDGGRIANQGSAFPEDNRGGGIVGTCGLCAVARVINKAGGKASENSVGKYALQNGLCSNKASERPEHRGGTTATQQAQILSDAGISSKPIVNSSLESLSQKVEQGYGVIISVVASLYKPEWYGVYSEQNAGGHAIVLESPVRDRETGKVIGYIVSDSNGDSSSDARVFVDKTALEAAFDARGGQAVLTDDVIW